MFLDFCPNCNQMKNHKQSKVDGYVICLKCGHSHISNKKEAKNNDNT